MTTIGKDFPVRSDAFRFSSEKRASSAATSPARTECFDIFSAEPGDSDVTSQMERLSSKEMKIAARLDWMAVGASGRSATLGMVVSRVSVRNLTLPERWSLSTSPWDLLVRRSTLHSRIHNRNGGLVSPRIAAGADPLGAHARSNRRAGSAGVPLHRHRRDASRNSRLVRPPLVRRDDVPGIPRPSGRRNRAAMVRSRHRANDASVARLVLARDALGGRSHSPRQPSPQSGRLVSETRTLLQRRNRRRSTVAVEPADFINVAARPRSRGNSDHTLAKTHRNALLRRVKWAKSSLAVGDIDQFDARQTAAARR